MISAFQLCLCAKWARRGLDGDFSFHAARRQAPGASSELMMVHDSLRGLMREFLPMIVWLGRLAAALIILFGNFDAHRV